MFFYLSLPIALFIGLIFLQIHICKNYNIKWGLVLPIIHLIPLIVILFSLGIGFITSLILNSNSSNNNIDSYILTLDNNLFLVGILVQTLSIIILLLIFIIPPVTYYLIYRHYKYKLIPKQELDKLNIQDL